MPDGSDAVLTLRAAGVSLAIDTTGGVPRVLHWGADLGPLDDASAAALRESSVPAVLNNSPDAPRVFSVWPVEYDGWSGTPAQDGHALGTATTPRPETVRVEHRPDGERGGMISISSPTSSPPRGRS